MTPTDNKNEILKKIKEFKKQYDDECLRKSQIPHKYYGPAPFNGLRSKYITPEGNSVKYSSNSSENSSSVYYSGTC